MAYNYNRALDKPITILQQQYIHAFLRVITYFCKPILPIALLSIDIGGASGLAGAPLCPASRLPTSRREKKIYVPSRPFPSVFLYLNHRH